MLQTLIESGWPLLIKDESLLQIAVKIADVEMIRYLIETEKFNLQEKNKHDESLLILAVERDDEGVVEVLNMLVATETFSEEQVKDAYQLLFKEAVENDNVETISFLANDGRFKLNDIWPYEDNPIFIAAKKGHADMIKILISSGCFDLNQEGSMSRKHGLFSKMTPLFVAVEKGHLDVVDVLLATGRCDVNQKNKDGVKVMDIATRSGNKAMIDLLKDHLQSYNPNFFQLHFLEEEDERPHTSAPDKRPTQ